MDLEKGIFTISIDFEFAWGYVDREIPPSQAESIRKETAITRRLLELFDSYGVGATWAIVGHLLETDCAWKGGRPHRDWPHPIVKGGNRDWFWQHPGQGIRDALWFDAENLIGGIKSAKAGHEIGSHSYAHLIYGDTDIDPEAIRSDLAHARLIHDQNGLPFRSFIYPRNLAGHQELLKEQGITCYRGSKRTWCDCLPGPFNRAAHIADYYLPAARTALPRRERSGLIAIDDSLLLLGRNGFRRLVGPKTMAKKAGRGIRQAIENKEIFHLWFHPSNFAHDTDTQFSILENILAAARRACDTGSIEIMTMGRIAEKYGK